MGVIITSQEDIEAYYNSGDMNQSSLKTLLEGMDNFLLNRDKSQEEELTPQHFLIGGAVDCKLTAEEGVFEDKYYVSQVEKKPTDTEMIILNTVWENVQMLYSPIEMGTEDFKFGSLSDYRGSILEACIEHNWQSRWKDETKVDKIIEIGSEYFEDIKRAYGKEVLDANQKLLIDDIVMSLRTNPRTAKYFDRHEQSLKVTVDYYYQLPIYFSYYDKNTDSYIDSKALIDIVIVVKDEHGNIDSIQGIDIKTMSGSTLNFPTSVKARRYDIQAAWYTYALISWSINQGYTQDDVNILPFLFIVESSTIPGTPLIYECTAELLDIGMNGRKELKLIDTNFFKTSPEMHPASEAEIIISRRIKGIKDLIDDYLWYEENEWQEEKVIKENDGVLKINWNGII